MPARNTDPRLADEKWLREQYIEKCRPGEDIAQEVGCTKYTVYRRLKKLGIERRRRTSKYPQLNDKEWLRRVYLEEEKPIAEIARMIGCKPGNIHSALTTLGIETRGHKDAFQLKYPKGRRGDSHPNWRGGRREVGRDKPQYAKRLGERAAHWKGGKFITTGGYIYIHSPDHPNATKQGYVMEHRLVVEEHIGRYLEKNELVHHINGNRQDNRWENLEVVTRSQHVSNHFADGYELLYWKEKCAELEAEVKRLRKALEKCKN